MLLFRKCYSCCQNRFNLLKRYYFLNYVLLIDYFWNLRRNEYWFSRSLRSRNQIIYFWFLHQFRFLLLLSICVLILWDIRFAGLVGKLILIIIIRLSLRTNWNLKRNFIWCLIMWGISIKIRSEIRTNSCWYWKLK